MIAHGDLQGSREARSTFRLVVPVHSCNAIVQNPLASSQDDANVYRGSCGLDALITSSVSLEVSVGPNEKAGLVQIAGTWLTQIDAGWDPSPKRLERNP